MRDLTELDVVVLIKRAISVSGGKTSDLANLLGVNKSTIARWIDRKTKFEPRASDYIKMLRLVEESRRA